MTPRTIVFDLDDTLYRERRFALSGYRAVARLVAREHGADESCAFRLLSRALRRHRRQLAFQDLAQALGLSDGLIADWVACYRAHAPALRLAPGVGRVLEGLHGRWRVGILTNGLPDVQASKVAALGLQKLVDAVVYADLHGGGKPHPEAFLEILSRLGSAPADAVFAGDDVHRDIDGAHQVGMKTVWVDSRLGAARGPAVNADAVVSRIEDVPAAAERLLDEGSRHVH